MEKKKIFDLSFDMYFHNTVNLG